MWPGNWILCCRSRRQSPPGTATGASTGTSTEPELEERLYPDGAGASDWPDWPVPARGWWYLEDRQEDETEDMWQRYSYNYTFAVYDPDTGILYYQELDT